MKSYSIIALLAACVTAQSATDSTMSMAVMPAPSSTLAAGTSGVIHEVTVGGEMPAASAGQPGSPVLAFSPDNIVAAPGDIVRFTFMQKNHSLAQSTFDAPCEPMAGGVVSGFKPNPDGTLPAPTFDFQVKETSPIWMYCQQTGHCGLGMVFAINPANATGKSTDKSFQNFKQLAISKSGTTLAPAAIAATSAVAQQAAGQTVTIGVSGAAAATGAAPAASASVAGGSGTGSSGQTCSCQCLCGTNSFPQNAGMGQFGGFLGEMPAGPSPQAIGTASPSGLTPARRALHVAPYRLKQV